MESKSTSNASPQWAARPTTSAGQKIDHVNIVIDLSRKGAPYYLTQRIAEGIENGYRKFKLRVPPRGDVCFPNICTPIAGLLDYYRAEFGCEFVPSASWRQSPLLNHSGTIHPHDGAKAQEVSNCLNKVWKYDAETHYIIVARIMDSLRATAILPSGLMSAIELALNEVTDNILVHSQPESNSDKAIGYVMVEYHRNQHRIAAAVYDTGIGIPASLAPSGLASDPKSNLLEKALEKGVTDGRGKGNGLWMMSQIVEHTAGSFDLTSDGTRFSKRHLQPDGCTKSSTQSVKKAKDGTTLVDFQLRTDREIDVQKALGGYEPVNLWIEDHLADSLKGTEVVVKNESRGCGSRYEAHRFATQICNLINASKMPCLLDFSNSPQMSASYADQLIDDLIQHLGIIGFANLLSFKNMDSVSAALTDRCFFDRYNTRSFGS